MTIRSLLLGAAFALAVAGSAEASVIQTFTAGPATVTDFVGQSVTTPLGGSFNNITFNFYINNANGTQSASAIGTLYILTQAYAGTPTALSSASTGFLASSTGNSGGTLYVFAPSVTLNANTQYFFYGKANQEAGYARGGGYAGGDAFMAATAGSNFANTSPQDMDFTLNGTPVPEPVTLSLFGAGLAGVAAMRRRKKTAR